MNQEIYDSDIESVKQSIRSRSEAPLKPVWPLAGLLMPWKKLGNLGMFYSLYKTLDSSYDHLKDRRKQLLPKSQDGNKIQDVSKSRINFGKLGRLTHIPGVRNITLDSGYTRDFNVRDIEQVQDSLLNHPELGQAQRLAILATSLGEAGHKGFDSRGIGGNGMFGISKERMPLSNVGSGQKVGGKQIHWFLNDLQSLHPDNWNHGGEGGLPILNAKDGRDKFYSTDSVKDATIYLNKGYIRPAERENAWKDRVDTAIYLQKFLNKSYYEYEGYKEF